MKKALILIIVIFVMALTFSACNKKSDHNDDSQNTDVGYVYHSGADPIIVFNPDEVSEENVLSVYDKLVSLTGRVPVLKNTESEPSAHEIIIGKSSRSISEKAYTLLDRVETSGYDGAKFLIYSDGSSVAIAFEGELFGVKYAENDAFEHFLTYYCVSEKLSMEKGVAYNTSYNIIKRQQETDKAEIEEYWIEAEKALTALYGAESAHDIIAELKKLYAIYTDDAVLWLADLYDPVAGGFYYSNSARNTEGFLPDLESTAQALSFIESTGMLRHAGGKVKTALSEEMGEAIVAFVKKMQDPDNGYFYHPQWSKTLTDSLHARRGRDVTNAINTLNRFGAKPTYDTPTGVKGDGIAYDGTPVAYGLLPQRLGASAVSAVSKVLSVNSDSDANVASHLRTREAFEEYLSTLDLNGRSYYVGNQLESQANQILARDKVLESRGEDYRLSDILADWFTSHQNPRTGTWYIDDTVDYEAVNGILKISSTYHRIEKLVPNADLCIKAAMQCLIDETPARHVCDVLNPWYAITVIRNNLTAMTGDDAAYKAVLGDMISQFARSIDNTREKLLTLQRNDGSFGYQPTESTHSAQGAPIAVAGEWEGDVNASYIATCIASHMYLALGINDYFVPIYTESDRMRFVSTIERLGEVIKDEPFDDRESALGNYTRKYGGLYYPENISTYSLSSVHRYTTEVRHDKDITKETHEYMQVVGDESKDSGVLEYGKATLESYYGLCFGRTGSQTVGNCLVFETEIKVNHVDDLALRSITGSALPVLLDIQLAKTTSLTAANVSENIFYDKVGGIYLSSDDYPYTSSLSHSMVNWQYRAAGTMGPEIKANRWYAVTVEIYDNGMAKYYVNNEYVGEARVLSDVSVFSEIDTVRLAFNSKAVSSNVWLDNTFVGNVSKEYVPGDKIADYGDYEFVAGDHYENFGGLDYNLSLVQTLEKSGYLVRSTYYTKNNMEGKSWDEMTLEYIRIAERKFSGQVNQVLEFTTLMQNAKGFYIRETVNGTSGDCFVFETDISLNISSESAIKMLNRGESCVASIYASSVAPATTATSKDQGISFAEIGRIYLMKDSAGRLRYYIGYPSADPEAAVQLPTNIISGTHTFTAEIYRENGYIKYFVDGIFVGEYTDASDELVDCFDEISAVKMSFRDIVDNSTIYIDNTFVGRVDKDYFFEEVEDYEPTLPDDPDTPQTPGSGLGSEDGDDYYDGEGWS